MAERSGALFILGTTTLGALLGIPFGGLLGALAGGLAGVCLSMGADAMLKARRSGRLTDAPAIAIDGLNDQQKFAVLGQGLGGGAIDFRPKVLKAVDEAESLAQSDLEAGLRQAKALETSHPHAPATSLLHATLAHRAGQLTRAGEAASRCLERATRGGMNAVAVESLAKLPQDLHDELRLSRAAWMQLARALHAAGQDARGQWAQQRAETTDAAIDERVRAESLRAAAAAMRELEEGTETANAPRASAPPTSTPPS